jgi:hypothetical protein
MEILENNKNNTKKRRKKIYNYMKLQILTFVTKILMWLYQDKEGKQVYRKLLETKVLLVLIQIQLTVLLSLLYCCGVIRQKLIG